MLVHIAYTQYTQVHWRHAISSPASLTCFFNVLAAPPLLPKLPPPEYNGVEEAEGEEAGLKFNRFGRSVDSVLTEVRPCPT